MQQQQLIAALAAIVGKAQVRAAAALDEGLLADWTGSVRGAARAAVFPQTAAEVGQVLAFCHAHGIGVTPQGGNTGMSGGAVPAAGGGIILAMRRLNRIRAVDAVARTITVEAGCLLAQVRQAAAAAGLFFPLSLGSAGSCQIGGNLATNAGGLNVLRYGSARDLCLGLEAVLADGRLLHGLSGLHKDNSGYDLRHLIIGSEGTLAVITAATLKLLPPPQTALTAWVVVESPAAALALMNFIQQQSNGALLAFEMLPAVLLALLARYKPAEMQLPHRGEAPPWTVLLEAAGSSSEAMQAILAQAMDRQLAKQVIVATSEAQRAAFWRVREETPLILARHGRWLRSDIALPRSALPAFITEVQKRLRAVCEGVYLIGYGHVGDGNLHLSARPLDADPEDNPQLTAQVAAAIYDCVADYGGTFSAEHGIGQMKTELMQRYKDETALAAMRAIKRALDEKNILNPGKVLA